MVDLVAVVPAQKVLVIEHMVHQLVAVIEVARQLTYMELEEVELAVKVMIDPDLAVAMVVLPLLTV